eukprot:7977725-Alexandrium_andersonii.AAC.1
MAASPLKSLTFASVAPATAGPSAGAQSSIQEGAVELYRACCSLVVRRMMHCNAYRNGVPSDD